MNLFKYWPFPVNSKFHKAFVIKDYFAIMSVQNLKDSTQTFGLLSYKYDNKVRLKQKSIIFYNVNWPLRRGPRCIWRSAAGRFSPCLTALESWPVGGERNESVGSGGGWKYWSNQEDRSIVGRARMASRWADGGHNGRGIRGRHLAFSVQRVDTRKTRAVVFDWIIWIDHQHDQHRGLGRARARDSQRVGDRLRDTRLLLPNDEGRKLARQRETQNSGRPEW